MNTRSHSHQPENLHLQPAAARSLLRTLCRLAHGKAVRDEAAVRFLRATVVAACRKQLDRLRACEGDVQRRCVETIASQPMANVAVGIVFGALHAPARSSGRNTWAHAWAKLREGQSLDEVAGYLHKSAHRALTNHLARHNPAAALWRAVNDALSESGDIQRTCAGRTVWLPLNCRNWPAASEALDTAAVARALGQRRLAGRWVPTRSEILVVMRAASERFELAFDTSQLTSIVAAYYGLGGLFAAPVRPDAGEPEQFDAIEKEVHEAWHSHHDAAPEEEPDDEELGTTPQMLLEKFETWWEGRVGLALDGALDARPKGSGVNALRYFLAWLGGGTLEQVAPLAGCKAKALQEQSALCGFAPNKLMRQLAAAPHARLEVPEPLRVLLGPLMTAPPRQARQAVWLLREKYAAQLTASPRPAA